MDSSDDFSDELSGPETPSDASSDSGPETPSDASSQSGAETSSSEDEADRHCKAEGNAGMADVISKMLGKDADGSQPVILSKRKAKHIAEFKAEAKKKKLAVATRRDWEERQHTVPNLARDDLERRLHATATKGVVKLFNAVSKQQKIIKEKLEEAPTEAKREKVVTAISKDNFLDMLRGGNTMVTGPIARKKTPEEKPSVDETRKETLKSIQTLM
ncbi:RRP15-like protein [Sycon ciliatum]|uniref:RRP15-like protein n=1 Tax=Sycon ciliatum TaxID=27933 RepID=UPI0020AE28F4|eukprot:scpid94409/ scgid14766/ RRP15-like protein